MGAEDAAARLGDLQAMTDMRLMRLDVEQLAEEVLDRLREILDADTVALLLHEAGTDYLVARAACGLEEEVRQGVRIPIGGGFAGRIAGTRRPVRLSRVDASTVTNPILWENGIQRMLGVPLLSGEDLLGVLHVGRRSPRDFTAEDEQLLQVAAERIALAVQSRRYLAEAAAADLLERGLLPPRLPRIPGLHFASRYVPTENRSIGGDWYDAFTGPDGALWVVIGDVSGHGLRAAVIMGRVKSALRAYTLLGEGPARVLELTDRKVVHFEMSAMITVCCARSYPPYEQWTISSAGHLPPLLSEPGRQPVLATVPPGPPLGAQPGCARTEVVVSLNPGGSLVLYTDGLIERRDEGLDEGLVRLCNAVRGPDDPDITCRTLMRNLVGTQSPMDDIAILALRRDDPADPTRRSHRREFEPEPYAPRAARTFALEAAGPLSDASAYKLELLVSELATNAVVHGETAFELAITRAGSRIHIEVADRGPAGVVIREPSPTGVGGRGLPIVSALADEWGVTDNRPEPGTTVWAAIDVTDWDRASPAAPSEAST